MARRKSLGKLTKTLAGSAPTAEARRVVAAFLRGEIARGACRGKGEKRVCAIASTGHTLEVGGSIVASRAGNRLSVCVPPVTALTYSGRKRLEAEEDKDVRVAASMLLQRVAGMGVRTGSGGQRLLTGRGKAALRMPATCVEVEVPKAKVALVLSTTSAAEAAKVRFKTDYPSRKQTADMRKLLQAEKRMAALWKAAERKRDMRSPSSRLGPADELPAEAMQWTDADAPMEEPPHEYGMEEAQSAAAGLPQDVKHPTDPESFLRFTSEYLPKLRKGAKRDMALAWQAYLTDPKNARRPGATAPGEALSDAHKRAARQVELEIADEYGIVDPNYGYESSLVAQINAAWRRSAKARKGKKGKSSERSQVLRNQEWAEEMRFYNSKGQDDYYSYRRSKG